MKNVARHALWCVLLTQVSMLGALTLRFLWVTRGQSPLVLESYLSSLYYAGMAVRNSILPSVLVGGLVLLLHRRSLRKQTYSSELVAGVVSLTAFYSIMGVLALLVGSGVVAFPRTLWLPAWAISIVLFVTAEGTKYLEASERRPRARPEQMIVDAAVIAGAFLAAYGVRFDGVPPATYLQQSAFLAGFVVAIYLVSGYVWDVYSLIWRFTSLGEAVIIGKAVLTGASATALGRILILEQMSSLRIPLGVLLIHPLLTFVGMIGVRTIRRIQFRNRSRGGTTADSAASKKVLLIGAGSAGQQLARDFERHPEFHLVGFLDDDPIKLGRRIAGLRVLGTTGELTEIARRERINEVVLSMPSAPGSTIRRIVGNCEKLGLSALSVPGLKDIVGRKVSLNRLRPVRMEDLLGRASIDHSVYDPGLVEAYNERAILVTGAAGSIGSELVRQVKEFLPSKILMLDKDENGLYEIELEIAEDFEHTLQAIIADVRDRRRLEKVFETYHPEVIFHAAAFKHVPLMEMHPGEAVLNNVLGTRNLVELAVAHGVKSFVLISTDKAVNPANIMGASKRVAEMIVQTTAGKNPGLNFCCVRFGNVLGSRASVVPLFRKRIAQGKNLTVTHPDITRYFMTIPEAVQLLIQAGSLGRQGEVFVLDMGDPVRIVDLARDLIELSGLEVGKDIDIEFTGLRPGEKLSEELLRSAESSTRNTRYPKILVAPAVGQTGDRFEELLQQLESAALAEDREAIVETFRAMNTGYRETGGAAAVKATAPSS